MKKTEGRGAKASNDAPPEHVENEVMTEAVKMGIASLPIELSYCVKYGGLSFGDAQRLQRLSERSDGAIQIALDKLEGLKRVQREMRDDDRQPDIIRDLPEISAAIFDEWRENVIISQSLFDSHNEWIKSDYLSNLIRTDIELCIENANSADTLGSHYLSGLKAGLGRALELVAEDSFHTRMVEHWRSFRERLLADKYSSAALVSYWDALHYPFLSGHYEVNEVPDIDGLNLEFAADDDPKACVAKYEERSTEKKVIPLPPQLRQTDFKNGIDLHFVGFDDKGFYKFVDHINDLEFRLLHIWSLKFLPDECKIDLNGPALTRAEIKTRLSRGWPKHPIEHEVSLPGFRHYYITIKGGKVPSLDMGLPGESKGDQPLHEGDDLIAYIEGLFSAVKGSSNAKK